VPRARRTRYAFLYCDDRTFVDIPLLLRGEVAPTPLRQVLGLSILAGEEVPLAEPDLALFLSLPSDRWVDEAELGDAEPERLDYLIERGLAVSDRPGERERELRRRDELLAAEAWHVYAALYHFLTKWRDADIGPPPPLPSGDEGDVELGVTDAWVERFGPPPPHFHALDGGRPTVELSLDRPERPLYELLGRRRTSRSFDQESPMTVDQLSIVLRYVAGCHGVARVREDVVALRKTSPSGGALHPTEIYPLVVRVDGLEPGLYHYRADTHALELVRAVTSAEAASLADEFTAAQVYPREAHALLVMTARFYRSFWKYRRHKRAYGVLLMDAGHLSQTFYLVCADLGLGAFVTAAIHGEAIESALGLDPYAEGAIAICGCGTASARRGPLEPEFAPYVPRDTAV
jgi:putative peptide maturation dehydrogenase